MERHEPKFNRWVLTFLPEEGPKPFRRQRIDGDRISKLVQHEHARRAHFGAPLCYVPFSFLKAWRAAYLLAHFCTGRTLPRERDPFDGLGYPVAVADHFFADYALAWAAMAYRRKQDVDKENLGFQSNVAFKMSLTLRCWPFSGVLAGIEKPPLRDPIFGGRKELLTIYARRWWNFNRSPAWLPRKPEIRAIVEEIAGKAAGDPAAKYLSANNGWGSFGPYSTRVA